MRSRNQIIDLIEQNAHSIINNIPSESPAVYTFLKNQFETTNILNNYLFQFIYRSFYRLDNAGLTDQFKQEYFNLLERHRHDATFDLRTIIEQLYRIQNHRGQNSLQFSFATKMRNTIDPNQAIYDQEVAKVFEFRRPNNHFTLHDRITYFLDQLAFIGQTYSDLVTANSLANATSSFDNRFQGNELCTIKKLDFIFWSAGKILYRLL